MAEALCANKVAIKKLNIKLMLNSKYNYYEYKNNFKRTLKMFSKNYFAISAPLGGKR
jgi:hypothetical protein